ncbi:autotransporter domain-containing protein [Nitratireductor sp. XY-223]|uniref:autotransporter family protein n=1 Tax=Nitratireductor sp. XY-223 TaxID=2561926 RepID=UPI00145B010B|nr:autotransporter domain-containing protein [Nitratireductor sp. XY-223]
MGHNQLLGPARLFAGPIVLFVVIWSMSFDKAHAACSNNTPADNTTVECTAPGTDATGVAGNDGITVNVRSGALIQPSSVLVEGIDLRDGATVLVEQGAEIDTSGNFANAINIQSGADIIIHGQISGYRGVGFGISGFSDTTVTLGETGVVNSSAPGGFGFDGGGGGNVFQIDGTIDTSGSSALGIVAGAGDRITIGSTGVVRTRSDPGAANAISADGFPRAEDITVIIDEGGLIETYGSSSAGVSLGANADVTVNGTIRTAQIIPSNPFSSGASGVAVNGNSVVNVGATGVIMTSFDGGTGGQSGHGITTGLFGTIGGSTVNMNGQVETFGSFAYGIQASQNDVINVGQGGQVTTNGSFSHAIYLPTFTTSGTDTIEINVDGTVTAKGLLSRGIYLFPFNQPLSATVTIGSTGSVVSEQALAISAEPGSSVNPIFPDATVHLTVAGSVAGPAADALSIDLSDGDDTLELHPGFSITGLVSGGTQAGQTDAFVLGGSGIGAFDVALVDAAGTPTIGEQFRDFETYAKQGDSTWTLTGTNTEFSAFAVNDGTLLNNADLSGAEMTVDPGAVLGGIGTIGGLVNNGTVATGTSIGTLGVANNAVFNIDSALDVELASDGTSDLLDVTGSTTINGGTVNVFLVDAETDYSDGQIYTIVTSDGGVSGSFDGVSDTSAFLDFLLDYNPNNVFLILTRVADFSSVARTFNQRQVARVLEAPGFTDTADGADVVLALLGLDEAAALAAFDAIQGEIHADSQVMTGEAAKRFNALLLGQLDAEDAINGSAGVVTGFAGASGARQDTKPGDRRIWAGLFGAAADVDGDGNAAAWDSDLAGIAGGFEISPESVVPGAVIGFGAGYSRTNGNISARAQSADIDSLHLGVYGHAGASRDSAGFSAAVAASAAYQMIDTSRLVSFAGMTRAAVADYSAWSSAISAEVRHGFDVSNQMPLLSGKTIVSPLVAVSGFYAHHNGFSETGAGALNLSLGGESLSQGALSAGIRIDTETRINGAAVRPSLTLAYDRLVGEDTPSASLQLSGLPAAFAVRGPEEDRDRARIESSLAVDFSPAATFSLSAGGLISSDRRDFSSSAVLRIRF